MTVRVCNTRPVGKHSDGTVIRYKSRAAWALAVAAQSIENHGELLPCHLEEFRRIRDPRAKRVAEMLVTLFAKPARKTRR